MPSGMGLLEDCPKTEMWDADPSEQKDKRSCL